jgi:hypothetical protein
MATYCQWEFFIRCLGPTGCEMSRRRLGAEIAFSWECLDRVLICDLVANETTDQVLTTNLNPPKQFTNLNTNGI